MDVALQPERYLARLGLDDRPPATLELLDQGGHWWADPASYDHWRAALVDDVLLPAADVTGDEWASLWRRTQDSHRSWDGPGRP